MFSGTTAQDVDCSMLLIIHNYHSIEVPLQIKCSEENYFKDFFLSSGSL